MLIDRIPELEVVDVLLGGVLTQVNRTKGGILLFMARRAESEKEVIKERG